MILKEDFECFGIWTFGGSFRSPKINLVTTLRSFLWVPWVRTRRSPLVDGRGGRRDERHQCRAGVRRLGRPADAWHADLTVFDAVYKPLDTRFLQNAQASGARTIDREMLDGYKTCSPTTSSGLKDQSHEVELNESVTRAGTDM